MSDMMTVRDHSEPCEHDDTYDGARFATPGNFWTCEMCPGGKEITLTIHSQTGNATLWVEADDE